MGMTSINRVKGKLVVYTIGKFFSLYHYKKTFISPFMFSIVIFDKNLKNTGQKNHDSVSFRLFIEESIATEWLRPYDILIYDNAAIHQQGYNGDLAELLWNSLALDGEPLHILLLPLPTRSPEINPIKLVWNIMVQRVKYGGKRVGEKNSVAQAAENVLNTMDFQLLRRTFRHCEYRY